MKTNKRALAIMTAAFMAMTPVAATGLTAFAEGETTNSISITPAKGGTHDYKAYQIFKGTLSGTGAEDNPATTDVDESDPYVLSDIQWGDNAADDFLTKLKEDTAFNLVAPAEEGGAKTSIFAKSNNAEDVAEVLKTYADNSDVAIAFAKFAGKHLKGDAKGGDNASPYKIESLEAGYYLVEDVAPITDGENANPRTLNMLRVAGAVTMKTKEDLPTLDKKITGATAKDDGKANAVSIGDAVPYEITSVVPDMTGYAKYFFVISDKMVDGLTFNNDVAITIGGTPVPPAKYEVQTDEADTDGNTFQIVFKDFYGNWKDNAGDTIVVTYSATLNENADRTTTGNLNTANLTYSNNPNIVPDGESPDNPDEPKPPTPDNPDTPEDESKPGDPVGKTPDKQTKTYTANIKLTKTDEDGNALKGAKFQISGTAAKAVMINGTSYVKDDNGSFYKLKDGTFTETDPNGNEDLYDGTDKYKEVKDIDKTTTYEKICKEAYVKADGTLEFGGLGAGEYTITELVAPKGFNKLEDPIKVVIKDDGITFSSPAWTATKDGTAIDMNNTAATVEFEIENKEGSTLPSTGGIGTKLFYLFGGILVAGSGILLITKKRMAKEN